MIAIALCVGLVVAFIIWRQFWFPIKADEPKTTLLPLITNNILVLIYMNVFWDLVLMVERECLAYGGTITGFFGFKKTYVVTDPDDCLKVLKLCPEKDEFFYDLMKPWLGEGALVASGQNCRAGRKLLGVAQSQKNYDVFLEEFNWNSNNLMPKLLAHVDMEPFDITPYLERYTLEVMTVNIFGLARTEKVYWDDYMKGRKMYMELVGRRLKNPLLKVVRILNLTALGKQFHAANKALQEPATEILAKYKNVQDKHKRPGHISYMNLLTEAQATGVLTEKQVRDEMNTLMFAAHDTTVNTLLFSLILLGSDQDIQDKVYQELQKVMGEDSDRDVTKDDLRGLVYLDAVLKETVRLFPYAPVLPRVIDRDLKLKDCTLYSKALVLLYVFTAQRHASWGAAPAQFRPERWLDGSPLPPLLGFSEGPRMCMGKTFAMMSMKTALTKLLRKCRVFSDLQQLKLTFTGVLEPKSGHHIRLTKR